MMGAVAIGSALAIVALVAVLLQAWRMDSTGVASVGGPFRLVDQTGAPVDQSLLRGKWSAVFFGYTYCPDVCPTTLATLGQAASALGEQARRFQVVFITVDPQRDTPKALATYLSSPSFPKDIKGLTGTPAQIAAVAKAYHVYYQKEGQGDAYTMDHSAVVYLMDPNGRFTRPLDVGAKPADIVGQIRSAMAGS
jgi:protein SCO1/2